MVIFLQDHTTEFNLKSGSSQQTTTPFVTYGLFKDTREIKTEAERESETERVREF